MDEEMVGRTFEQLLHPLAVTVLLLLVVFVLFSSRRWAIVPLFIAATMISMDQRLIIIGADFTMLRILIFAYFARVMIRGEFRSIGWNRLDTAMLLWNVCTTAVMLLAHGPDVFVNRLGWAVDSLGIYFVARCLIRSWSDVKFVGSTLAVLSVPVAILFAVEWSTSRNMFSVLGGVPAETVVRGGRLRCQGAFAHPILAGTFWAAALPLIWILRKDRNFLMRLGTIGCLFIVAACSSSTPILSVLIAAAGVALFPWRRHRTKMWVGLFALVFSLHVVMKAPVWALMARVDFTGGSSTGYHRYAIFDAFVNHFSEWYLMGEPDPMSWGVWEMRDVTNMYIAQGLLGGLLGLSAFLLVLIFAFGNVGRALNVKAVARSPKRQWICWCIGVAILVHAVTFLGVAYFGQMIVMLYMQLSLTSCVYIFARRDSLRQRAEKRVSLGRPIPTKRGPRQAPAR